MSRTLQPCQLIEQSILKTFRSELWSPFVKAIRRYRLIRPGDRIAVCISGGKDSMLMAKMLQLYARYGDISFEPVFLVMDPGYSPANRRKIESNIETLQLPALIFESDVFEASNSQERHPCYLCARMRRGCLYNKARELGCNKLALGHHFNDVVETTVMAMFWGAQLQAMRPILRSSSNPDMEVIRPLYMVHEDNIIDWSTRNGLSFIQCACRFTEDNAQSENGIGASRRKEIKEMLRQMRKDNPDIEKNIFASIHNLDLDTFPGWRAGGVQYYSYEDE